MHVRSTLLPRTWPKTCLSLSTQEPWSPLGTRERSRFSLPSHWMMFTCLFLVRFIEVYSIQNNICHLKVHFDGFWQIHSCHPPLLQSNIRHPYHCKKFLHALSSSISTSLPLATATSDPKSLFLAFPKSPFWSQSRKWW